MKIKVSLALLALASISPALAMMAPPKVLGREQSPHELSQSTYWDDNLVASFRKNNIEAVKRLIRDGANQEKPIRYRNKKSGCDNTAGSLLINAILDKNVNMAHALIEEGANCNVRCYQGDILNIAFAQDEPALVLAAERNLTSVCKLLLEHGADANAQTNDGETALAWAVQNKNQELEELLYNKYRARIVPHLKKKKDCCPSSCSIQ